MTSDWPGLDQMSLLPLWPNNCGLENRQGFQEDASLYSNYGIAELGWEGGGDEKRGQQTQYLQVGAHVAP